MKGKIKIMKTRPEVTDQEIKSYMDFDGLLKKQQSHQGHQDLRLKVLIGSTVFITLAVIGFLFVWPPKENIKLVKQQRAEVSAVPPMANQTMDTLSAKTPKNEKALGVEKAQGPRPAAKTTPKDVKTETAKPGNKNSETIIEPVYRQAEPRDGYPVLYAYFEKNLVYPHDAVKDSVEGVVNVIFSIDADGKPRDITIENSLGPLFDQEAIRLLNNMPLWKPASYNGKVVPSKISLPITFDLNKTTYNK